MATQQKKESPKLKVVLEGVSLSGTGITTPDGNIERFYSGFSSKRDTGLTTRAEVVDQLNQSNESSSFVLKPISPAQNVSPLPKPAILARTGTVGSVPIADRKKPVEKASTLRHVALAPRQLEPPAPQASFISIGTDSSGNQIDVNYLVSEALEISRQVDEQLLQQSRQLESPALPIQRTERKSKRSRSKGKGKHAAQTLKVPTVEKAVKDPSVASLYETEQTRLVDSLILQLKQSATGIVLTDTDVKIRDVTKQIAESLGIPPEELDPELFSLAVTQSLTVTPVSKTPVPVPHFEYEQSVAAAPVVTEEVAPEPSLTTPSILTTQSPMDEELAEIVKEMPEEPEAPISHHSSSIPRRFSTSREAFVSGDESDLEVDDLNEMGQLAALPEVVTVEDVLCIQGRSFKLGSLKELDKDDKTVETKDRLEKILEQQSQHAVDDGRVHIHKLCFDDPKSEGLLPNDLQQVSFETHVNRRFNHRCDEQAENRPAWYKAALEDLKNDLEGGQDQHAETDRLHSVPYVNVDDALFVPGLKPRRWPPGNQRISLIEVKEGDKPDPIEGSLLPLIEQTDPKFPIFSAGASLIGLTPQQARKQLFPNFESSADARLTDYLIVRPDSRFDRNNKTPFELFVMNLNKKASSMLKFLVSKDDMNLMPRFQHRLPRSSPPHRRRNNETHAKTAPSELGQVRPTSAIKHGGGVKKRRWGSFTRLADLVPILGDNSEPTIRIKQDYKQAIGEVELHKKMCQKMAQERKEALEREEAERIAEEERKAQQELAELAAAEIAAEQEVEEQEFDLDTVTQMDTLEQTRQLMTPSDAELALWSVRRPSAVRRLGRSLKPRKLDSEKLDWVKARLANAPRISRQSRRHSCPPGITEELKFHHSPYGPRSTSPDAVLDFDEYSLKNGMRKSDIPREWVRGIWEVWFDEVIPPLEAFANVEKVKKPEPYVVKPKSPPSTAMALAESLAVLMNTEKKATEVPEEVVEVVLTNEIFDLDLPPVKGTADDELEREKVIIMKEEIERLTSLLEKPLRMVTRAITLTRRGAILRKLGKLVSSLNDLNKAIELMPNFIDALWHRHFIYLVENKVALALADLNLIIRIYRFHAGSYMSRAAIYTQRDDFLEAIDDYTMAIRSSGGNAEAFFLRAKLYERKGEPLLAMEDFMRANQLMPNDTTALMCHAMHYVRTENYPVAVQDLTQILEREPANADMYILRGQCLVKQTRYELACADFSAAIYLKPGDPEPYFQRGCILRKSYPDRALTDFSISLLLDSSNTNIRSLLHRGILYFEMGFDHDAEDDFEAILRLDRDHPAAHTNLGRIYLNKRLDYTRAVRRFSTAIRADPTYRQAYLCRAEAQNKLKNYAEALRDFTKAIHLEPNDYSVYVHRGAVVLRTGNYNLATFCIRQATEAQKDVGPGSAVYQKAFVQAFLKRFDKAIETLQSSLRNASAQALIVLGKVHMKAQNHQQAADCFTHAIDAMRPKRDIISAKWPDEVPEIYYLRGRCFLNLRKWSQALESFNDAIKVKPDFAEAYYRRGVVRFALKHSKAIEDIHRALALDPKIFEAYLTRAVYFAQRKLWPLAIVNCNEATKLEPRCIRAYVYRGAFKFFSHNYKGAVEDLNEAARLDRNCVIAFFNRACSYQLADCLKLALRDYSTILLVESQHGTNRITYQTYVNRGLLYFNRRDYANALADFRLAAQAKPQNAVLVHALALCYHKQNLLKKSVLTYCQAVSTHPYYDDGYIGRANALVDYNTKSARVYAMKEYMRRLYMNPKLHEARINLAICLQMTGRLHQAYRQLTIVIKLLEDESAAPLWLARARELRGVVSMQAKSFDASFQDLSTAARIRPSAQILNNRGVCNLLMDSYQDAVKDFRESLHLDPRFSIGYYNLAIMFMRDKRWEQAKDFFDRSIIFGKTNETAMVNRSVVLTRMGDLSTAFNDLKAAKPLSPHAHHIPYNRAVLHRMVKKLREAIADIEEAIRLKPDDPELYRFRALIRGEIGNSQGSMEDYAYAADLGRFLKEAGEFRENNDNNKQLNSLQLVPTK